MSIKTGSNCPAGDIVYAITYNFRNTVIQTEPIKGTFVSKARKKTYETADREPRTLIIGVHTPTLRQDPSYYFDEFMQLVKTAQITPEKTLHVKLRSIDQAMFFTKGKLHDIIEFCTKHKIEAVVVSSLLSAMQERNLEDILGCKVFDRAELIIEIFNRAATSAEGKIQVEMAYLEHLKSRLAGRGKEMAQQEGFVGARGPGESMKEELRRYYEEKMRQARKRLAQVAKTREVQRKQRLRRGVPLVCLVGYTNAGKSSILNTLTKSDVLAEDKLFATLDTTTRELFIGHDKKVLIADTVGFISQLPPRLVEAFKSTLDELTYASHLLHVIDASNKAWRDQIAVVNETLKDLKVTAPVIHVFNKVDLLDDDERASLAQEAQRYQPALFACANSKDGVATILKAVEQLIEKKQ